MSEEKENNQEEIKEIIEDVKDDIEDVKENIEKLEEAIEEKNIEEDSEKNENPEENNEVKKSDSVEENKSTEKKNKKTLIINYSLVGILVVAVVALIVLDYPKIAGLLKKQSGYSFDYNFSKVRDHDWDTLITEKKVASALGTPLEKINSAKNPDYSWVLQDPEKFINDIKCASLVDMKVLNEISEEQKNLFTINVTVCKDKEEAKTMFSDRKEETNNASKIGGGIELKNLDNLDGIGNEGYTYLIEKAGTEKNPEDPNSEEVPGQKYGGAAFVRGPFVVMIDESEQQGMANISEKETLTKLLNYIDKELKRSLTWF